DGEEQHVRRIEPAAGVAVARGEDGEPPRLEGVIDDGRRGVPVMLPPVGLPEIQHHQVPERRGPRRLARGPEVLLHRDAGPHVPARGDRLVPKRLGAAALADTKDAPPRRWNSGTRDVHRARLPRATGLEAGGMLLADD